MCEDCGKSEESSAKNNICISPGGYWEVFNMQEALNEGAKLATLIKEEQESD
jgi:hypothetical protein